MTTIYALHLKLDILLHDQPQRICLDSSAIWDFEPERRLIWIDQDKLGHICEVPPVTLPFDYRPHTICGREVSTTRLQLVDTEECPLPSCPACYGAHLKRLHGYATEPDVARRPKRSARRSLWVSIFVATFLLAPSFDELASDPETDWHDIAHGPLSSDEPDTSPGDQDL
jgi:hypothetical protein